MMFHPENRRLLFFLAGSDSSWATPVLTHTYFRNFQMYAGTSPSDLQGAQVSAARGPFLVSFAGPFVTACSVLLGLLIW